MTAAHVARLAAMLQRADREWLIAARWGRRLSDVLPAGARLLVAGNGGSAAQAQHLSAEIVGRYRHDRRPFSALSLHTDTSAVTAIVNDYGPDEVFARQVEAHGRPGDGRPARQLGPRPRGHRGGRTVHDGRPAGGDAVAGSVAGDAPRAGARVPLIPRARP